MTPLPPKVVCLGSLNMDLVIQVQRAPAEGETVEGDSIRYVPGGKGANQAVSCARQGARVSMMGRVGPDHHGEILCEALKQDGILVKGVSVDPDEPTGVAMVMVEEGGLNRIVVIAGANGKVSLDESQLVQELSDAQFLVMQFEVPMAQVLQAAKVASRLGCKVVLNPSPAKQLPEELWPLVDVMIVNETEARFLTGLSADTDPQVAAQAGQRLMAKGVTQVVVTLGALGAVATDDGGSTYHPAPPVQVVDTTAAGDTFLGVVTVGLACRQSLATSVNLGIRASTLCIQTLGAQPSIPTLAQTLQNSSVPSWISL
ncbi:MAG: ribokinase [Rhodoferax ferrireducens]|uniref:Ribokinase n=1 Tax=Rhodoferax ferrireducens TaxID=192843 RepID=A0A1W9KVC8_9BURK|nr:MAG: ribokinase [Rhodoferax ferrireducens]